MVGGQTALREKELHGTQRLFIGLISPIAGTKKALDRRGPALNPSQGLPPERLSSPKLFGFRSLDGLPQVSAQKVDDFVDVLILHGGDNAGKQRLDFCQIQIGFEQ